MFHDPNDILLYNILSRLAFFSSGCTFCSSTGELQKYYPNLSPAPRGFDITQMSGAQVWVPYQVSLPDSSVSLSCHPEFSRPLPDVGRDHWGCAVYN